ncbi:MAG: Bifunctional ligase/repressor BirA [Nitrospira sp.]|nr:Bifunctional ligase/repressor BirA [Nitrospira sp.]
MTVDDYSALLPLLNLIADGEVHSGVDLARRLGVSRAAVCKRVKKLADLELRVTAMRARGYQLARPLEFLVPARIIEALPANLAKPFPTIEVLPTVGSTNSELLQRARSGQAAPGFILLAEQQTAGRGRRGRPWVSPFGRNLYLSALWRLESGLPALEGLSLVVGVVVAETLRSGFGIAAGLKWPNDIVVNGRKIGGILIELDGDLAGPLSVVIGIGINIDMTEAATQGIEQAWTDVRSETGTSVSRNDLSAQVIAGLAQALERFSVTGFKGFRQQWCRLDAFHGLPVNVSGPGSSSLTGIARGVDETGALLLETGEAVQAVSAGDVTLRSGR